MFKMFAADLDGTLLQKEAKVSEQTVDTIKKLKKAGVYIVIASGRSKEEILELVSVMELDKYDKAYLITYNGALTVKANNMKTIREIKLKKEDLSLIINIVTKEGLGCHVFPETGLMITSNMNEEQILGKKAVNGFTVIKENLDNIPEWAYKILVFDSIERLASLRRKLPEGIENTYGVFKSAKYLLEFSNKTATKGNALADLAKHLGIDQKDIIAFGDEENDISLLKTAGIGVAMANAIEIVKKNASLIAPSNDEDGVSKVLEEILNRKEGI